MLVYQRVYHIPVTLSFFTLVLMEKNSNVSWPNPRFRCLSLRFPYMGVPSMGVPPSRSKMDDLGVRLF